VQEFTVAIRERRNKLAPQINELRSVRQQAGEVEQEWEEKKSQYEYQEGLLMQDVTKIEAEVGSLTDETRVNEALYHRINAQLLLLSAQLKRAQDEEDFVKGSRTLDAQYRTYAEMLTKTTENLERRTKELQRKRREVEENHSINIQQVDWFAALKKILECKLHSVRTAPDQQNQGNVDGDIQSIMSAQVSRAGVDMLVLGNN
jgi:intraflagellar transport protein 81